MAQLRFQFRGELALEKAFGPSMYGVYALQYSNAILRF